MGLLTQEEMSAQYRERMHGLLKILQTRRSLQMERGKKYNNICTIYMIAYWLPKASGVEVSNGGYMLTTFGNITWRKICHREGQLEDGSISRLAEVMTKYHHPEAK